jgi:hypothetical protein
MHVIDNTTGADQADVVEAENQRKTVTFRAKHFFEQFVIKLTAYTAQSDDGDLGNCIINTRQSFVENYSITHDVAFVDFAVEIEFGLRVKTLVIERGDEELYVMTKDADVRRAGSLPRARSTSF